MKKVVSGHFRLEEVLFNYDFELVGDQGNDMLIRLKANYVNPDPTFMFIAGLMLMHYLAEDFGYRIDVKMVPKLPSEEHMFDAVEKLERSEKQ